MNGDTRLSDVFILHSTHSWQKCAAPHIRAIETQNVQNAYSWLGFKQKSNSITTTILQLEPLYAIF